MPEQQPQQDGQAQQGGQAQLMKCIQAKMAEGMEKEEAARFCEEATGIQLRQQER